MGQINYKLDISYDGTRYRGWQKQPGADNTIQGKLESVIGRLLDTEVEVLGAGRTDAGVHAAGQVANFRITDEILERFLESTNDGFRGSHDTAPGIAEAGQQEAGQAIKSVEDQKLTGSDVSERTADRALLLAINHYLPEDIAVTNLVRASERFHARYRAAGKWYRYTIRTSPIPDVFGRRFLWQYGEKLDTARMQQAAAVLIGRHDFTSFCGLKMKKSAVRTIEDIQIRTPDPDSVVLDYTGDGFLNHQVRLMTGELVEVGAGRADEENIRRILFAMEKGAASHTAPAGGLTLMQVKY